MRLGWLAKQLTTQPRLITNLIPIAIQTMLNLGWRGRRDSSLSTVDVLNSTVASERKRLGLAYGIHLHYPEFVPMTQELISRSDATTFFFVTTSDQEIERQLQDLEIPQRIEGQVFVRMTPNRGRNFGPQLVEFREQFLRFDCVILLQSSFRVTQLSLTA